ALGDRGVSRAEGRAAQARADDGGGRRRRLRPRPRVQRGRAPGPDRGDREGRVSAGQAGGAGARRGGQRAVAERRLTCGGAKAAASSTPRAWSSTTPGWSTAIPS